MQQSSGKKSNNRNNFAGEHETQVITFFTGRLLHLNVDLMPLSYVLSEIVLLIISRRIVLYDVTETVIETIAFNGKTGFVSFDDGFHYLGSNQIAKNIFPELTQLRVDDSALKDPVLKKDIIEHIHKFIINPNQNSFFKNFGEQIFQVDINKLFDGRVNRGYILYIQDDTKDQKYISLLNGFNDKLRDEVSQKTEHIVEMHNNLIMGMATMVESRDNSTGGHIKRTSKVVDFLITEIQKDKSADKLQLSADFCHNIIKAAPMHDLGKIAVDDAILRKPGRFTDEEFEVMKTHAAEGARIVHEILKGTDDTAFHLLAENIAHYHHERWEEFSKMKLGHFLGCAGAIALAVTVFAQAPAPAGAGAGNGGAPAMGGFGGFGGGMGGGMPGGM